MTQVNPLTDCLGKQQPDSFIWDPSAAAVFECLRHTLVSQPGLASLNFTQLFIIQTDASRTGLGAVLTQVLNGEKRLTVYLSCKLHPAKQQYSTIESGAGDQVGRRGLSVLCHQ